jgi:imidazolonepropionase-like amidohydrolase
MRRAIAFLVIVLFLPAASRVATAQRTSVLALTHVSVIDGSGGPPRSDQTVLIASGRIAEIGTTTGVKIPPSARIVDGSDKFLIPGLWDMHVHIAGINADPSWSKDVLLPLLTAYGITGVRDMGGDLAALKAWRSQIAAGNLLGPEIVAGGPMLVSRGKKTADQYPIANEEEARGAVRELKEQGADFIKIISVPSREAFFAIAEEAKKQGMTFVGHVPFSVTAAEASDAGMKSIEHIVYSNLAFDCSSREEELRRAVREAPDKDDGSGYAKAMLEAIRSYSPGKAAALWARFKRNGTWVVPTLESISEQGPRMLSAEERAKDPNLEFIPPALRKQWDPRAPENQASEADLDWWRDVFASDVKLTREMHKAGVQMLAGSDSLDRFVFPGSSLHQELHLLVEAGLTPMEALQSATRDAARFLGREKDSGTIAPGVRADLVLLDGNPLQNISNTTRIRAVIRHGVYLDRTALDGLLADAKAAAAKASVPK